MGSKEPENVTDKNQIVPPSPSKASIEGTTSKDTGRIVVLKKDPSNNSIPWYKKFYTYLYNKDDRTVCGRPKRSWLHIVAYSIIYLMFLCTYTMVFLYATLLVIKSKGEYQFIDKTELLTYSYHGVGLSATPTDVSNLPLIWYKESDANDYHKYVNAIDKLLINSRRKRHSNESFLGPCGRSPYGYGEKPCVIIRINKQIGWAVKPVDVNSSNFQDMPVQLKQFLSKQQRRLILTCDGYHEYDKEHVGTITYFPDPPGFDASIFPIDMQNSSPLVAIQISDFTLGISIAIECKLWYDGGISSVHFLLYVTPNNTAI